MLDDRIDLFMPYGIEGIARISYGSIKIRISTASFSTTTLALRVRRNTQESTFETGGTPLRMEDGPVPYVSLDHIVLTTFLGLNSHETASTEDLNHF